MSRTRPAVVTATFAAVLVLGACEAQEPEAPEQDPAEQTEPTDPTDPADPEDTDSEDTDPEETDPDSQDTEGAEDPQPEPGASPVDAADLPGESIELFYAEGDLLDVIGVEQDDVLYVRELPDPGATQITALDPITEGVATTGRTQQVESGIWLEVEAADQIGWANTHYLAYLGLVTDETSQVSDPGPQESAADLEAAMVDQLTHDEEGPQPEVTLVQQQDDGDLVTRVTDVREGGDDSIGGQRLHIRAEAVENGEYVLVSVESTQICLRGATADGCL